MNGKIIKGCDMSEEMKDIVCDCLGSFCSIRDYFLVCTENGLLIYGVEQ